MIKYPIPNRLWQCIMVFAVASLCVFVPFASNLKAIMIVATPLLAIVSCLLVYLSNRLFHRPPLKINCNIPRGTRSFFITSIAFILILRIIGYCFSQLLFDESAIRNANLSIIFVISATILGPCVEEVLFRGIFLQGLLKRYRPIIAILFTSIFFASIHFDAVQLEVAHNIGHQVFITASAFFIGLFLGYVYYRTKSVVYTVILHSTANISSLLLDYLPYPPHWIIITIAIIFVGGLIFLWHTLKNSMTNQ